MRKYALVLAGEGYILRSGGADGADSAFEQGCDNGEGKKEIFLPWKNFNHNSSPLFSIPPKAFEIAEAVYGSRWRYTKQAVKKLMARNIMQVAGEDLKTLTDFVICWTLDGCTSKDQRTGGTGGTGQAIAYASELGIPIFNLRQDERKLFRFLQEQLAA